MLYSDEVTGAPGQIVVVAEGLSRSGQARLAVFTGYLPDYRPPGIQGDSFRLTADVAAATVKPQAVLIALNGLARPPAGAGDSWHFDQSAVITLTGPEARRADVRIELPSENPRTLILDSRSGYAEAVLGAVSIPLDRADTVFSLIPEGDPIGRPFRVIAPDTEPTTAAGWPLAAILVS